MTLLKARNIKALGRFVSLRPAIDAQLGLDQGERLAKAVEGLQFSDAVAMLEPLVGRMAAEEGGE